MSFNLFSKVREKIEDLSLTQKVVISSVGLAAVVKLLQLKYYKLHKLDYKHPPNIIDINNYFVDNYEKSKTKFKQICDSVKNCKYHSLDVNKWEGLSIDVSLISSKKHSKEKYLKFYM